MNASTTSQSILLIVDSPHQPRRLAPARKYVRFALEVDGLCIKYPSNEENQVKWYDNEDKKDFELVMIRDVIKCSAKMASLEKVRTSELFESTSSKCVGLGHLISRDVTQRYRELKAERKEHVRVILEEQHNRGLSVLLALRVLHVLRGRVQNLLVNVLSLPLPWTHRKRTHT